MEHLPLILAAARIQRLQKLGVVIVVTGNVVHV